MSSSTTLETIALTGTTGKLGGAILHALLTYTLHPTTHLIILTSSPPTHPTLAPLAARGIRIRPFNYHAPSPHALTDVDRLLLVSTPEISLDYAAPNENADALAPPGRGREAAHIRALEAARQAGVKHVWYTSLGFFGTKKDGKEEGETEQEEQSKAAVMAAHLRTEAWLRAHQTELAWTAVREGLYSESWPLYLGHWGQGPRAGGGGPKGEERRVVRVAGDGGVRWVAIADLGVATAALLTAERREEWAGRVVPLVGPTVRRLVDVARVVGAVLGEEVRVEVVSREEHVRFYVEERGMDERHVRWWSRTYAALEAGEAEGGDPAVLTGLLDRFGRAPKPFEDTVKEMLS